jgi:hypothetical protein
VWEAARVGSSSDRISDAERDRAAAALKEHLLAGRLSTEEFSERVERAYGARVGADLELALRDLPDTPAIAGDARRRASRLTGAVLSHVVRRGRRRLRGWIAAASVLGDLDLDLREAELERASTVVNVVAAFGNVDVYVPDQIAVTTGGIGLLGHQRDHGADVSRPGAPSVHVRVLSVFGTVDVWRVPAEAGGDYGRLIAGVRRGERGELEG